MRFRRSIPQCVVRLLVRQSGSQALYAPRECAGALAKSRIVPMAAETTVSVVAAIVGKLLVTATKFSAAAFSGSSAMLSEAIHSLVDTGNGALMLYGMRRSL